MALTLPSRTSKLFLEKQAATNAQLKKFLKSKGCTTRSKRQAAVEKAAVKS